MPTEISASILREVVKRREYKISLNLHLGAAKASLFTCDLSYEYVKINAEYTT
jgi:glutamate N-acetyltransferase/amino-acid N-acetyltransferase